MKEAIMKQKSYVLIFVVSTLITYLILIAFLKMGILGDFTNYNEVFVPFAVGLSTDFLFIIGLIIWFIYSSKKSKSKNAHETFKKYLMNARNEIVGCYIVVFIVSMVNPKFGNLFLPLSLNILIPVTVLYVYVRYIEK